MTEAIRSQSVVFMRSLWRLARCFYCKNAKLLAERQPATKLVGDCRREMFGREIRHSLEFLREVRLVVVVIVEFLFEFIKGTLLGPFPIEPLKTEDPRQNFGRQTHMLFEQDFQIASRVTRLPLQLPNRYEALSAFQVFDAMLNDMPSKLASAQTADELVLDAINLVMQAGLVM